MSLNIEMVPVPAGSFQRDEGDENISVITKPYSLSKYQITRQQFLDIMGTDPSDTAKSSGMTDPVQMVSWYHAIAFCNKLSLLEGLTPAYTVSGVSDWADLDYSSIPIEINEDWNRATCNWGSSGYRLPTEMEWMWAAMGADQDTRSGAIDADGINRTGYTKGYAGSIEARSWEKNLDDYAWYEDNSDGKTHPVGGKLPNELGLCDMSGNVWEWCWDLWVKKEDKPTGTLTDYRGADSGSLGAGSGSPRVNRGGSWLSISCTVAGWYGRYLSYRYNSVGFRILRPVQ